MRPGITCVIVACWIAMLVQSGSAQGTMRTSVTGAPPLTLGTPLGAILSANPTFHLTSAPCPVEGDAVNTVPTENYETMMTAPIAGYTYRAHVVLCFYQRQLGAIHVEWPSESFRDSVLEWRWRAQGLARQLNSAYPAEFIKRNFVDDDFGGRVEIRDAQGNMLTMVANANAQGLNLVLDYVGAGYHQALIGPAASLEGSY